jgi:hypothetical protein
MTPLHGAQARNSTTFYAKRPTRFLCSRWRRLRCERRKKMSCAEGIDCAAQQFSRLLVQEETQQG